MSVEDDIENAILGVLQVSGGLSMASVVERVRLTPAGAGRPALIKAAALRLVAEGRVELTPDRQLRLSTDPTEALRPGSNDFWEVSDDGKVWRRWLPLSAYEFSRVNRGNRR